MHSCLPSSVRETFSKLAYLPNGYSSETNVGTVGFQQSQISL